MRTNREGVGSMKERRYGMKYCIARCYKMRTFWEGRRREYDGSLKAKGRVNKDGRG